MSNSATITTLTNSGAISGGAGNAAFAATAFGGAGLTNGTGAKISNLTNNIGGTISGGAASGFSGSSIAGGGAGVSNANPIATLTNSGAISWGAPQPNGFQAGAGAPGCKTPERSRR